MPDAVTLVFVGRFRVASFVDFLRHRAHRLALKMDLGKADVERIEVTVEGDPALVDAFDMACSLGPIDCLVLTVLRESTFG